MNREQIIDSAKEIICKGREAEYGSPENNFDLIAGFWTSYLGHPVTAKDVAMMMALLKTARIATGRYKEDSYIDLVGYAAWAGELAEPVAEKNEGKHLHFCNHEYNNCPCNTCIHDGSDPLCCDGRRCQDTSPCPDYEREAIV